MRRTEPFIDSGELHIPFDADETAKWWQERGVSALATLRGLDAPLELVKQHIGSLEVLEQLEERAAIMQHEGGMTKAQAEEAAVRAFLEEQYG